MLPDDCILAQVTELVRYQRSQRSRDPGSRRRHLRDQHPGGPGRCPRRGRRRDPDRARAHAALRDRHSPRDRCEHPCLAVPEPARAAASGRIVRLMQARAAFVPSMHGFDERCRVRAWAWRSAHASGRGARDPRRTSAHRTIGRGAQRGGGSVEPPPRSGANVRQRAGRLPGQAVGSAVGSACGSVSAKVPGWTRSSASFSGASSSPAAKVPLAWTRCSASFSGIRSSPAAKLPRC